MSLELTEQQKAMQDKFKLFVKDNIVPFADDWDQTETLPQEAITNLAASGFLGATIQKEFGGQEMDPYVFGLLCEEMGKGSISLISLLTVHGMVCQSIAKWGTDEQKKYWLPRLASGQTLAAFALSEPNVGSDPKNVETTAAAKGNGKFVINGKKKWISCGQIANLYLVVAQCDGRPTAFLLERTNPCLTVSPIKNMYGFRSAMLAELTFNNCEVGEENIIGKIGFGFSYVANTALDHGRYCIGWGCVGLGQACLDASLEYASTRKQFGVQLRKHQLILQMIADMATEIKAARALCLHAAYLKNINEPDLIMETSIAKYFASKIALRAANNAVQIHGANGCSNEFPVQRYLRDAKITEIIEGSTQIQQLIISQYAYQRYLFSSRRSKEK
ncbi:MAG: acyl-CoA/acyl-ACP dehydrogenase [Coxiellaceae bacterium]|jgi:alkylation response protein AidB-like acyl-CoA dehydrogenase|nr:acyl-CoA/acyl-ACP dehydrogenase [Coxiellaceae bacterium]